MKITKYCFHSGFRNKTSWIVWLINYTPLFSVVLKTENSKNKLLVDLLCGEDLPTAYFTDSHLLTGSSHGKKKKK